MRNHVRACVVVLAAAAGAGAAGPLAAGPGGGKTPAPGAVGSVAPEVDAREWIGSDGRTSLADFRGEVVLLEFWGTH
jgi:hypothetical protein